MSGSHPNVVRVPGTLNLVSSQATSFSMRASSLANSMSTGSPGR